MTSKPEVVAWLWEHKGRNACVDRKYADELIEDGECVSGLIRQSDHILEVGKMVEALTSARETLAFALRGAAPVWFKNDEDIAQHLTIRLIDAALGQQRTANPSSPSHRS